MDIEQGRKNMEGFCSYCSVCNGKACVGQIPGMGGKDSGRSFYNNVMALQEITVNMRVLYDAEEPPDLSVRLWDLDLSMPILPAPIGGCRLNMSKTVSEEQYTMSLLKACADTGLVAGLGDGADDEIAQASNAAIKRYPRRGIPFIKPWSDNIFFDKIAQLKELEIAAVGIDIDSLGLSNVRLRGERIPLRTNGQIAALLASIPYPVLIKGIMRPEEAQYFVDLGVRGIIVSNHGGRILDCSPGTATVLPDIVRKIKGKVPILVDGGVQTGLDVYKMLMLGADGVMIGRGFTRAVMSDLEHGAVKYIEQLRAQLSHVMLMTGCRNIQEIYHRADF